MSTPGEPFDPSLRPSDFAAAADPDFVPAAVFVGPDFAAARREGEEQKQREAAEVVG